MRLLLLLLFVSCQPISEPLYRLNYEAKEKNAYVDRPFVMEEVSVTLTRDSEPVQGEKVLIKSSTHPELILSDFGITDDSGIARFNFIFDTSHLGERVFLKATHESNATDNMILKVNLHMGEVI